MVMNFELIVCFHALPQFGKRKTWDRVKVVFRCTLLFPPFFQMPKELKNVREELRKEIRLELKEFWETVERKLGRELRERNVSQTFLNKMFEEFKSELKEVKSEQKELWEKNATLQALCQDLKRQVDINMNRILW